MSTRQKKVRKPLGGVDMKFYQNMGGHISQWLISQKNGSGIEKWRKALFDEEGRFLEKLPANSTVFLKTHVYSPYEKKHLLDYSVRSFWDAKVSVNGKNMFLLKNKVHLSSPALCAWINLNKGWNELTFRLETKKEEVLETNFKARIVSLSGKVLPDEYFSKEPNPSQNPTPPTISEPEYFWDKYVVKDCLKRKIPIEKEMLDEKQLNGYVPGIGAGKKSAGRFGFNKGDGMLDCSMPVLGMFSKPYLFGHPGYKKSIMWHFSVMPPWISDEDSYLGNSAYTKYEPGANESLDVNWISVLWKKQLATKENFYHRRKGVKINFSCTYSIASPGVIIETDDAALRLNGLETAGNYHYIMLPLSKGWTVRKCEGGTVYDKSIDDDFTDNWILMWGNDSFPDVPLMLTLQKNPEKIIAKRSEHDYSLTQVDILSGDTFGWGVLQFPFGFEVFKPEDTKNEEWLHKAVEKCAFQSKAVLAYPVDCKEFYKINKDKNNADIVQKFSYRFLKDAWDSKAIMTAPLPPPLSLIEDLDNIRLDSETEDFDFPTKYGPLKGVVGRDSSSYSIPLPPSRRKFCMKPSGDESIAKMISSDFKDYLAYHRSSEEIPNPGVYQFILQYVIPLLLFNFIDEDERKILEKIVAEGVLKGVSPKSKYIYKGGKECCSWYKRTEPFTGLNYMMTYLHIFGINNLSSCEREIIENANITFNEIDWGNAFSIYSIYLGAMLSGNWQSVEKNWGTLKRAFDYFIVLQDWACMATAYREEGTIWNDGTNYGAYVGFARIAEILGDGDAYAEGMYAFAKLAAMRMGMFRSSQNYFHKYFGVEPYWISKCFNEETDAGKAFINAPETYGRYRPESISNMTTEGHYPEAWNMYSSFLPEEIRELLKVVENAYDGNISKVPGEGEFSGYHAGISNLLCEQELFSCIMMALNTGYYSNEKLLEMIKEASDGHRLSEEFLGAPFAHRRVPAKWAYCFLKSQVQGDKFPLSLTGWYNLRVDSAEYDDMTFTAKVKISSVRKSAWIEFELKGNPEKLSNNGVPIEENNIKRENNLIKMNVNESGIIEILFQVKAGE